MLTANALLVGLTLGAASVLSLGPNSLMMIREGLTEGRVGLVATLVWASYLPLFLTALVLASTVGADVPSLKTAVSWFGCLALLWFAWASFRTAWRASRIGAPLCAGPESRDACIRRVLHTVWSNPLTYLEQLMVPTALCATFKGPGLRAEFILGLAIMATARCYGYSFGGRLCASVLRHRRMLQAFDLASGLLLCCVAVSMVGRLMFR